MLVLLDTDICIHLINRRPGFERVLRRLSGRSLGEICISAITISELRYGVAKSTKSSENTAALEEFLSRFELLDYPVDAAETYGRVRAEPDQTLRRLLALHAEPIDISQHATKQWLDQAVPWKRAMGNPPIHHDRLHTTPPAFTEEVRPDFSLDHHKQPRLHEPERSANGERPVEWEVKHLVQVGHTLPGQSLARQRRR